jgi:transcriptional regulator with XRE-family HTH domain
MNAATAASDAERRTELASFLRSRRERIRPEEVGMPPGGRRRISGLRREELAVLAGVSVTWYTWLEQGRRINVSVQVLNALARTLRLDPVERAHLFYLAEVPEVAFPGESECPLPDTVRDVLDTLPYPASVVNDRLDILAWNQNYQRLFPRLAWLPPDRRNQLYGVFTAPACCSALVDREEYGAIMTGQLRAAYARHVGDPAWTHFIRRLQAESPQFAATWAANDVAQPASYFKALRHPGLGEFRVTTADFAVQAVPGARMSVYTPADPASRATVERLNAGEGDDAHFPCWPEHSPGRAATTA